MSEKASKRGADKALATADNTTSSKGSGAPPARVSAPAAGSGGRVPPLFRRIDWYTFALTTLVTMIGYWWTLAPDLTLQDSGELAVGSFYAGVPHPPGYPVWTIYTWLFTVLFPVSNIAYRVAFSSAVAGALSCGLVGLMVSRGSSMMIEGIDMLRNMDRKWENWLCLVSGFVAGMLIGFNGFMWSQAVIVEVYTLSVLSMSGVLAFLMRWIYAPHQRKYLYWAFFWFGISFNNHQSLLVIAIGLEVAVLAASPRLGRDLFFWNTIVWLGGWLGKNMGLISTLSSSVPGQVSPLFVIYNLIGITSLAIWIYLAIKTKIQPLELARDLTMVAGLGYLLAVFGVITNYVTYFDFKRGAFVLFNIFGLGSLSAFVYLVTRTRNFGKEWRGALACGLAWLAGAAFYVYMPLASMTNPPLNWGYPRTVQGFFHAFTRGQYERINPTTETGRFFSQVVMYVEGAMEEFNLVYLLIGLVPFLFFRFMKKRERAWLIGLTAIYLTLSVFLLILLNPAPDRQSRDLNRVFFTASHFMIAMGIGYGIALITASLATLYERFRKPVLIGFAVAAGIALFGVVSTYLATYYYILRLAALVGLVLALAATALIMIHRRQAPLQWLLIVFAAMPLHSILSHWSNVEQRGHLFGFWFGHDMFTPPFEGPDGEPIYPEMDRDTVLFGGTDPGRFNPTYMIFCEGFIPPSKRRDPDFDRRDVYLITQNALADGTYLDYIRAHYNRSTQNDPYFFSELFRGPKEVQQNYETNFIARLMLPLDRFFTNLGDRIEKDRRTYTSWFDEEDFTDVTALKAKLLPGPDRDPLSQYLFENLDEEGRSRLTGDADEDDLREVLAENFNRLMENEYQERRRMENDLQDLDRRIRNSAEKKAAIDQRIQDYLDADHQIYKAERFQHVALTDRTKRFLKQSPASHTLIRLNRILLEEAYPDLIRESLGGVYPDLEINTPSPAQSQQSFQEYLADAQKRLEHDRRFPNEPPQIKPGENVQIIDNRVQVSGQVAVMAINALLTKVIFDANPDHAFYVEESFPLDWMFPYLTPYGIIMKINRNPVPEFTQEIVDKDHLFWSLYSERLIGNWITYDTTVSNVCDFVERVHIRRDYSEFEGDSKFIRDTDAQKAFSKLRSSIGGLFNYRISNSTTPAEQQRVIKEAEFAFKQSYAFCPYSPEALFRFVQLLTMLGRVDEALLLARTSYKMDPYNGQIEMLISQLNNIKRQQPNMPAQLPPPAAANTPGMVAPTAALADAENAQLAATLETQPAHLPSLMRLVQSHIQNGRGAEAVPLLDRAVTHEQANANVLLFAVQKFNELGMMPRVESTLSQLSSLVPESPEVWFDLAAVRATLNQPTQAVAALRKALEFSARRQAANPTAANLLTQASNDPRFAGLRDMPEFQAALQAGAAVTP